MGIENRLVETIRESVLEEMGGAHV
jgi:hypothetical protein